MSITAFKIEIPDSALSDLRERLARTRWPQDFANDHWQYGTRTAYLKELCHYWETQFDWRAAEREMNAFAHFRTTVEGIPIHFIHERGKGPNPKPLILSHGWPWTFWDLKKVIRRLSDPAAFGGNAEDAFDVIVPSLPGYGFSTPLTTPGINFWRTADLWVELMAQLGYPKFYAEGGDWGALVTAQLGHKYADRVLGVYMHLMVPLDVFNGGGADASEYAADEQALLARNLNFFAQESGYSAIQMTKPQTIAHALHDSPAGLCSWILEKRRSWSHCNGDVESVFSKDELCTVMTLYWATQSYGTSARYYYECTHNPWRPSHDRVPVVESPTGIAVLDHEVANMPRQWRERYYNLKHTSHFTKGGHFAPMEVPESLVDDIRTFFRKL
ncbi:MAG: epoxide hydrolase family protein [Panacagrimonas sp.]